MSSEDNYRKIIKIYKDKKEEELEEAQKKVKWQYNNRSELEYKKYGLIAPDNIDNQVKNFLSKVDPRGKYVPIRSVKKIVRQKAPDWDDKYHREKEWLTYYEDVENAKDFMGRPIKGYTDHLQGVYDEIVLQDVIDRNGDLQGSKMAGTRKKFYIPFSKAEVDKIIATSDNTDKNNIKFLFKGYDGRRNGDYTYDQFVNSTFDQCVEMMSYNGGPRMWEFHSKLDQSEKEKRERMKKYKQDPVK